MESSVTDEDYSLILLIHLFVLMGILTFPIVLSFLVPSIICLIFINKKTIRLEWLKILFFHLNLFSIFLILVFFSIILKWIINFINPGGLESFSRLLIIADALATIGPYLLFPLIVVLLGFVIAAINFYHIIRGKKSKYYLNIFSRFIPE